MSVTSVQRQIAMVLDLNKCLGCQTCTIACKKLWTQDAGVDYVYWNNVETHPGQGFPKQWSSIGGRTPTGGIQQGQIPSMDDGYGRAWNFNHEQVFFSVDKLKPYLKPDKQPAWGPNWDEDRGGGTYPQDNHYFYLPRLCNHCTHPACLEACPRTAIYKRTADGIVVVDQDRCHGYRFCVEACPYKKVFFDTERQVAAKCIFCFPRVEQGTAPACARQCPGRLRFVGYLDDQEGPIHKLVNEYKVALPLHAEFGTIPNVFYIPPMSPEALDASGQPTGQQRIPLAYLVSLFGPRVSEILKVLERERDKKRAGQGSELMDLLIAFDWNKNFKIGGASGNEQ